MPMSVKETHLYVALSVCLSDVVVKSLWVGVLFFCSEFHVGVDRVEVFTCAVDVCVVGVVNYQDVVNVVKKHKIARYFR